MKDSIIRITIVEDNSTIRNGLKILLNGTEGLQCVATYTDCETMLENLESDYADLMLMDIGLPGMSGIEGIKKVKEKKPDMSILMLTVYEDEDNIFKALCNGADGYLLKNTPPARLIECIYDASNGGSPMSSLIARKVVSFFKSYPSTQKEESNLSSRELEILNNLAKGNSYKIIADRLFISTDTVRYHIRNIYRKLQVHSQSEAVAKAFKKGWI